MRAHAIAVLASKGGVCSSRTLGLHLGKISLADPRPESERAPTVPSVLDQVKRRHRGLARWLGAQPDTFELTSPPASAPRKRVDFLVRLRERAALEHARRHGDAKQAAACLERLLAKSHQLGGGASAATSTAISADFASAASACVAHGEWRQAVAIVNDLVQFQGTASRRVVAVGHHGSAVFEKRVDPSDGRAYSREEFAGHYGGLAEWRAAASGLDSGGSTRAETDSEAARALRMAVSAANSACARAGRAREALGLLDSVLALEGNAADGTAEGGVGSQGKAPAAAAEAAAAGGPRLDVVCFGAALNACAKAGDAPGALETLRKRMPAARVTPNAHCIASTIEACGKAGRLADALAVLAGAEDADDDCARAAAGREKKDGEGADRVEAGARERRASVDVVVYGAAVAACERARDGAAALQVVSGMERRGWRPNVVVLNSAMSACAKSGMFSEARDILNVVFPRHGLAPDIITFNTAINACAAAASDQDDEETGGAPEARPAAQGRLPAMANATGRWKDALELLDAMQMGRQGSSDSSPRDPRSAPCADVVSFTAAMTACGRSGQTDRALMLLEELILLHEMDAADGQADVQGGHQADARALTGRSGGRASSQVRGLEPNVVAFGAALSACGKAGEWARSLELLRLMPLHGVEPNKHCFDAVVDALEIGDQFSEADIVYQLAIDAKARKPINHVSLFVL